MPTAKLTVTIRQMVDLHTALGTLSPSGERLPVPLALALAELHQAVRPHAEAAIRIYQDAVEVMGERPPHDDTQFVRDPRTGEVVIQKARLKEFRAREKEIMEATKDVKVPTVRAEDFPAHVQPSYALIAALYPFLARGDDPPNTGAR